MSTKLLRRAWETEVNTVAMKCLLMSLVDHYNDKTNKCYPSIKTLSIRTSMTHQSVINNTIKLVNAGLITVQKNAGNGSGAKSNRYNLHLGQSQRDIPPQKSKKLTAPKVKEIGGKVKIINRQSQGDRRQSQGGLPEPLYNSYKEPLSNNSSWSNDFDRWWKVYPVKVGKKPAAAVWKRIKPDVEVLITDIKERLAKDNKWKKGYIFNPTKYLKEERWNDEITHDRKPATNNSTLSTPQSRGREAIERKRGGNNGTTLSAVS